MGQQLSLAFAVGEHSLTWWAVSLLVVALTVKTTIGLINGYRTRKLMPPGPPGLPLLGNVFQLPQFQWLRFTEWKAQFGWYYALMS